MEVQTFAATRSRSFLRLFAGAEEEEDEGVGEAQPTSKTREEPPLDRLCRSRTESQTSILKNTHKNVVQVPRLSISAPSSIMSSFHFSPNWNRLIRRMEAIRE